jgi:diguanylate cyclase (GGDEF)-like protein/PAS domain S-box-containing protein
MRSNEPPFPAGAASGAPARATEERFRLMVGSILDYAFFMLDPAGRVLTWNEGARRLKGYGESEIVGQPYDVFFTREDREAGRPASLLKAAAEQGRCEDEGWRVRKDGSRFFADAILTAVRDDSGALVGFAKITRDVTERRRLEQHLQQQAKVFHVAQEGIVITDAQGCVVDANRAFERITEYSVGEIRGRNMRFIQSGRHDHAFYERLWKALSATGDWRGEIWNRRKSGEMFLAWISITSVRDAAGVVTAYVGILIDLARMQHAQSELERLAHHDALTSLPNRALLLSRLEQAISRANRHHGTGAVLFLDLDGFKQVNDALGHRAGDELLMAVATRLRVRLRIIDMLARLGGDEFVVVLEDITGAPAASSVAEDLIHQLSLPFTLSGGRVARIGGSVGIALFPAEGSDALQLLEQADQALYAAKQAGRGTHRFFEAG